MRRTMPLIQKLRTAFEVRDLQMDVNQRGPQEWEVEFEIPDGVDEEDLKFHGVETDSMDPYKNSVNVTVQERDSNGSNEQKKKRRLKERLHKKRPELTLEKLDQALDNPGERIPLNSIDTIQRGHLIAQRKTIHPEDRLDINDSQIDSLQTEYKWTLKADYERKLPRDEFKVRITYDPEEAESSEYPRPLDSTARFVSTRRRDDYELSATMEEGVLRILIAV